MTQRIVIEGDLVRVVEESLVAEARLVDFLPHIENRPPITLMHPRSAIFTHWDEQNPAAMRVKFLCELAPGRRNIVKAGRRYELAMPWTYFIFEFTGTQSTNSWSLGDGRVYHTNAKVETLQSRLWTAFLPNVYEDGRICFGSTGAPARLSISARVDQLVNEWYLTNFNNDLISSRTRPFPFNPNPKASLRPWVDETATHGAGAWTRFPEWTDPAVPSFTVSDLFQNPTTRMDPMNFTEEIPALPIPATFGRVEEWYTSLTPAQQLRIQRSITNNPITPDETVTAQAAAMQPIMDDGGVPV